MTEKLKQIIKEEITKLSKEEQDAINSIDWTKMTEEIGKKYLLDESQINDFQAQTLLVLVGLTDLDLYIFDIENEIGTTKKESVDITNEAVQKIFTPINNIVEDNIKRNLKNTNPDTKQTLNFILSGGDYSAFRDEKRENSPLEEYSDLSRREVDKILPPRPSATPQEGNSNAIEIKPEILPEIPETNNNLVIK